MRVRSLPARAIGAAIAMLAVVAPAPRVGAASASACTAQSGVTVIVDFSHFHLAIERGCAPGHPPSALAALDGAGFDTAGTAQYGDAFVCRINGMPSPAKESCAQTPPAAASWSFYSARRTDQKWTYTTTGVTSYRPGAGTIIAFAFGNLAEPGILPTQVIATPTTTRATSPPPPPPPSTTAPPAATVSAQTGSTTTAASAPPTSAAGPATTSRPPTSGVTPTAPAPAPVPAATTTTTAPRVIDRSAARTVAPDDSGSPLPLVLTVVLLAMLGAGGFVATRSRRRRSA